MEFLKKHTILLIFVLLTFQTNAQTQQQLRDAYSKSYSYEKEGKYGDAKGITPLLYANFL